MFRGIIEFNAPVRVHFDLVIRKFNQWRCGRVGHEFNVWVSTGNKTYFVCDRCYKWVPEVLRDDPKC